jgi:hypothetical protein
MFQSKAFGAPNTRTLILGLYTSESESIEPQAYLQCYAPEPQESSNVLLFFFAVFPEYTKRAPQLDMVVHTCNTSSLEAEVNLDYMASSRPLWVKYTDFVSNKDKNKQPSP